MNYKNIKGVRKENTMYEGIYKYFAPDGYEFWVDNDCFGNVIYGEDELINNYYLKVKEC